MLVNNLEECLVSHYKTNTLGLQLGFGFHFWFYCSGCKQGEVQSGSLLADPTKALYQSKPKADVQELLLPTFVQ
jgi:hypothetical protein